MLLRTKVGAILLILFSGFGSNVSAKAGDLGAWSLDPLFTNDFRVSLIEMTRQDVLFAVGGVLADSDEGFGSCSIYKKTNITSNWILLGATPICFSYLTASDDGMRLTAATWGSEIYTSSDGGINWVNQNKADSWWGFSSSSSGQLIIGITEKKTFWLSRDYGMTWTSPFATSPGGSFTKSAISEDGRKMLVGDSLGYLYVSTDRGNTWRTTGEIKGWSAVAISANGSRFIAAATSDIGSVPGGIFVSSDDGVTWRQTGADNMWWHVETTPNGNHLVATTTDKLDFVFVSNDAGQSWQTTSSRFLAGDIAITSTGQYVFAMLSTSMDYKFRLYFAEYKCGIGGIDTCAQAAAAEAKREAEKQRSRAEIVNNLKFGKDLSLEMFAKAEIQGITATNFKDVQAELIGQLGPSQINLNQVLKIARKYEVVGKLGTNQVDSLQSNVYVEIGLIPSASKNKVALVSAIRKLPTADRDTFPEIKSAIEAELAKIQARKDRSAAIRTRISSRLAG